MAGYGYSGNYNGRSNVPTVPMYHSTDKDGASGIRRDRMIAESSPYNSKTTNADMAMGEGVYLHPYNPRKADKEFIARNNYDDGRPVWDQKVSEGKTDYYVKVNVPVDRLEPLRDNSGRQVYKHQGPIDLDEYGGRVYKVPDRQRSRKN